MWQCDLNYTMSTTTVDGVIPHRLCCTWVWNNNLLNEWERIDLIPTSAIRIINWTRMRIGRLLNRLGGINEVHPECQTFTDTCYQGNRQPCSSCRALMSMLRQRADTHWANPANPTRFEDLHSGRKKDWSHFTGWSQLRGSQTNSLSIVLFCPKIPLTPKQTLRS